MEEAKTGSEWLGLLRPFARPNGKKAIIQLIDTLLPYCALIILMYITIRLDAPMWITLLLGIPAGAFMVRSFILFHDCCHGSFVASRSALDWIGRLLGFLTFTPYGEWRHSHGLHHFGGRLRGDMALLRPPPPPSHSQLQSPRLPGRGARAAPEESPDDRAQREVSPSQSLGRGGEASHRL
jgi:hypothetical protein